VLSRPLPHCGTSERYLPVTFHTHQPIQSVARFQEIEVLLGYKRTDVTESHGECLIDLVYWTLSVTEAPRTERDTRDSVA
jgi:hypothetical protein